jgi:hypothetical protein
MKELEPALQEATSTMLQNVNRMDQSRSEIFSSAENYFSQKDKTVFVDLLKTLGQLLNEVSVSNLILNYK